MGARTNGPVLAGALSTATTEATRSTEVNVPIDLLKQNSGPVGRVLFAPFALPFS